MTYCDKNMNHKTISEPKIKEIIDRDIAMYLVKGTIKYGVPFDPSSKRNSHYCIVSQILTELEFQVTINIGDDNLWCVVDDFNHQFILNKLSQISEGIYHLSTEGVLATDNETGIRGIDYIRDPKLYKYFKENSKIITGTREEVIKKNNSSMACLLNLDNQEVPYEYRGGSSRKRYTEIRAAYKPKNEIEIFAFGDLFSDRRGVHNIHLNQGNPKGSHSQDNGIWQDGVVIIKNGNKYSAFMSAFFLNQKLPTKDFGDEVGYPVEGALSILDYFKDTFY